MESVYLSIMALNNFFNWLKGKKPNHKTKNPSSPSNRIEEYSEPELKDNLVEQAKEIIARGKPIDHVLSSDTCKALDHYRLQIGNIFKKAGVIPESLPDDRLPRIVINENLFFKARYYHPTTNTIYLGSKQDLINGRIIGGEIGHSLRDVYIPYGGDKPTTAEFFDFLGQRILYKSVDKNTRDALFEDGSPNPYGNIVRKDMTKKEILEISKELRKRHSEKMSEMKKFGIKHLRDYEALTPAQRKEYDRLNEQQAELYKMRESKTHHMKPYEFASRVDLDKIPNYQTVFNLPESEVRRRFFRSKPTYDNPRESSSPEPSMDLSGKLALIFGSLSLLLSAFMHFNISGNAILATYSVSENHFSVIFFLIGFLLFIAYLIKK